MTNIEELRKQLNVLEDKDDALRQQRLVNQKEITHIKSLIVDEERKFASNAVMPLAGKYVKWVGCQPKAYGYNISKYIHIDKITEKQEVDNKYIITGQSVELFRNDSNELVSYRYCTDYYGVIYLDWNDPVDNYFKPEDLTEIDEQEFNLAKEAISTIL